MKNKDYPKIPENTIDFQELSKLMRINVDILKQEITDHVNSELERLEDKIKYLNKSIS